MRGLSWRVMTPVGVVTALLLTGVVLVFGLGSSSHAATRCQVRVHVGRQHVAGATQHAIAVGATACADKMKNASARHAEESLEARRKWLASSAAVARRAASQMAFHGLSSAASERLLSRDFGARMQGANPAATVAHAGKLMRYIGDNRALVRTPHKRVDVITSTMPLVTPSGGVKRPVDLSLRREDHAFAAINPLQRISISNRLDGGVAVGTEGIRVLPVGADVTGTAIGGQSVFFAGVGPDEDVSVAPRIEGAELSTVLRSRLSPQQIVYRVALPSGASMTELDGGAAIMRANRVIGRVPAPTAVDAQNSFVPVQMRVAGNQLVLSVADRTREVAYPIFVDPRIITYIVNRKTRNWEFWSCAALEDHACGEEQSRSREIKALEPGVLTAPRAEYGTGEIEEGTWVTIPKRFEEDPSIFSFEFVYWEPQYTAGAEWSWRGPSKKHLPERITEVTYEGVSVTPGDETTEAEQNEGHFGTGWWTYSIGCYGSSNLDEAPPETLTSSSHEWRRCVDLPGISLSLHRPPEQGVFWFPPGRGFSVRVAPTGIPTTLSMEAAVIVEERSPHRRRGRRKGELLGSENPSEPDRRYTCEKDPVNCATGNLTETQTDLNVPDRGVGLTLERTYNAQAAAGQTTPGPFGYGWNWSFGAHLSHEDNYEEEDKETETQTVEQANGSTVVFTTKEGQTTTEPGVQATLNSDSTFTLPNQDVLQFGYRGELVSETDRNGNVTTLNETCEERESGGGGADVLRRDAVYTAAAGGGGGGRCLRSRLEVIDPAGRKLTLYKNSEGLVEKATDPMGHTVTYGYEDGNLVSVTEPGESTPRWRFEYDSEHRMTAMIDGRGGTTTNTYNAESQVTSQTDPGGDTRRFEYQEEGGRYLEGASSVAAETKEEEDLPEFTEEEEEDIGGAAIVGWPETEPPLGTSTPPAFTTKIIDEADDAVRLEHFNSEYALSSITDGYGTSSANTRTFTYDAEGNLASETNADGHTTSYEYGGEGNKTSETDPLGRKTQWTYDSTHDVISETTPSEETTTIHRDEHGNAIEVSRPAPNEETQTTKYTYNAYGELTAMTNPLGHTWKYEYDEDGDRTAEVDPEGNKRTFAYNEDSQEISTTSPRGNASGSEPARYTTTIERDAQGRVIRTIEPLE